MSTSPYISVGELLKEQLKEYLEFGDNRDLSLEKFFLDRIKVKSLHSTIVPLVPKKVQILHQQTKDRVRAEGKPARFLLLKSRRMGMTTWEQALSYRAVTSFQNTTCVTLADNKENTKNIFRMVNLMRKMDHGLKYRTNDSKVSLEIPALNSFFHIGTAGSRSFSRGDNLYRAHGSEVAWWPGDIDTIDNLMAGITEAARHGEVILETTANGANGWYYEMYKEAIEGNNTWTPLFYPWFLDPENIIIPNPQTLEQYMDTITPEEQELMESQDLSTAQMLWRRQKQKDLKKLFPQEYPEHWSQAFLVRGNVFFDLGVIEELTKRVRTPINNGENLIIWKNPIPNREYTLGADTAEGLVDSDNSVCGVLDIETGEQVAVLRGKWRPEVFGRKCVDLARKYNNALFACEINNHGHSTMNTVMNTMMYPYLYYREKELDKNVYGDSKTEKVPGWQTNAKTRPILLDELNEALEERFMYVNDEIFLAECKTFVDRGGRYEADKNQKDDSIIAWGIAWQARKQRKIKYTI